WEARTAADSTSWTAEMRIPFSQLRFNDAPRQLWGMTLNRWVPSRNEDDFWVYVPKNSNGWASHFGNLIGIEGIQPSRRVEVMPYMASEGTFRNRVAGVDPFNDSHDFDGRAGGDVKVGLGPNLTLDATVNPDFGQVEADPAEVNLTAFETFFDERRPFFTEGSDIFRFRANFPYWVRSGGFGNDMPFYSRRLGRSPQAGAPDPPRPPPPESTPT